MSTYEGWPYRVIVPQLIGGGPNEGALVHVELDAPVAIGRLDEHGDWVFVTLVSTGDIEWHGERPIEVWVPEDRLAEWREDHPLPPE